LISKNSHLRDFVLCAISVYLFMLFQLHNLFNSSWYYNGDCGLPGCVCVCVCVFFFFWYFVGRLVVRYSIKEKFASFTVSCMGKDGSDKEKQDQGTE
jgi:hypothetical protein